VLDAASDKGYRGRVRQVWPTADRQKATVEMRVEFLERPPILKPEMGARVTFLGKDAAPSAGPDRPKVPKRALTKRGATTVVFVLTGGAARQTTVTTGAEAGGFVDVESGLYGGESVILDPAADLVDGARVVTPREAK
jgi:HlyD family secretion protein